MSDWADQNIVLPDDSAEPGPYRTSRTPYVREIQDSAALAWVHQVTIIASTQVGKTAAALNVLAYAIAQDPGPITWVMPTREDAAEFGENRVQPLVDRSPALRAQMTGERFDAKKRQIRFRRCRVLFRSARIPKELAQYPARYLFGDEAGKWPQWTQDEAAPFDLARERCRTFWNHKVFLSSTPTVPDGLISLEFARGDKRHFHVPCPHCGRFQVLRWPQVKWDNERHGTEEKMRAAKEAWYECEHCRARIVDAHKQVMLGRGWWCPEAVDPTVHIVDGRLVLPNDRAPHRSYHLWAGYSPWLAWWEIVAEWLRSKDTPASLQNFVNSWLGEPWVEKVEDPKPELLRECIGGYRRGEVPAGVQVITAAVDVQKRFLVFTIRGWGLDMESWLLDHGRVDSFPALAAAIFARPWPRSLMVRGVFCDSQYRQPEVIEFARSYPSVVKLLKGDEFDDPRPFSASKIERHPRTGAPIGLMLWLVNVGLFKDEVANAMRIGGQDAPGAFHIYEDADDTYRHEMTSEHKILVRSGSRVRERWVQKYSRAGNHYWDTEVYNRALAKLLRVDDLRAAMEREAGRRRPPGRDRRRSGDDPSTGFGGVAL